MDINRKIISFKDLSVYRDSYEAMLKVLKEVVPYLPINERYDLTDQISRSCKSIPRLVAEGYAKRHQKAGFQKYLDDAMAESNELVVSLTQCLDIYPILIKQESCQALINMYDKLGRQLYRLNEAWSGFKKGRNLNLTTTPAS